MIAIMSGTILIDCSSLKWNVLELNFDMATRFCSVCVANFSFLFLLVSAAERRKKKKQSSFDEHCCYGMAMETL